ncbi:MAG: hypothetical protein QM813_16060 [Verrucomicrobiota bacterium]
MDVSRRTAGLPGKLVRRQPLDGLRGRYRHIATSAITLYDFKNNTRHQVTSGFYNDEQPVFDPEGKYLYFRTGRSFNPIYSDLDNSWIYANTTQLAAAPLRKDVPSPLAPRNDEESEKKDADKKEDEKKSDEKKSDDPKSETKKDKKANGDASAKDTKKEADKKDDKKSDKDKKPKAVEIDLAGFEERAVILPTKAGRYADSSRGARQVVVSLAAAHRRRWRWQSGGIF